MRSLIRSASIAATIAIAFTAWLNAAGSAPVADAAMKRDADAVRALLKNGEDVNAAQGDGMTALHWAARRGDLDVVKMLLAAGANVRATTRLGNYTPLLLASEGGHAAIVEALVAAGADPKAITASGVTPLAVITFGSAPAAASASMIAACPPSLASSSGV